MRSSSAIAIAQEKRTQKEMNSSEKYGSAALLQSAEKCYKDTIKPLIKKSSVTVT